MRHDPILLDSKRVTWEILPAAPTPLRGTMDDGSSVAAPYHPLAMREIKNKYCWAVFISIIHYPLVHVSFPALALCGSSRVAAGFYPSSQQKLLCNT